MVFTLGEPVRFPGELRKVVRIVGSFSMYITFRTAARSNNNDPVNPKRISGVFHTGYIRWDVVYA